MVSDVWVFKGLIFRRKKAWVDVLLYGIQFGTSTFSYMTGATPTVKKMKAKTLASLKQATSTVLMVPAW